MENTDLSEALGNVLDKRAVSTLFQPIVDLKTADVIGYEVLSRGPKGHPLHSPLLLIEQATKDNRLWQLEVLFREKAIEAAGRMRIKELLFINVDPNVVNDPSFISGYTRTTIEQQGLRPETIVFEITERSIIENASSFREALQHYIEQGYKTAIDDVGAGYSNMSMISQVKPNFIKIDMDLVRGVDDDLYKQAIIKSFVFLANYTNTKVIAEGIETRNELKSLISLGVNAGQGFLLGRPNENAESISDHIKQEILFINNSSEFVHSFSSKHIGAICEPVCVFQEDETCGEIKQQMHQKQIEGACIVSRDHIVGLIMRDKLNSFMSARYGYSLHANRPIKTLMDSSCLIVDYFTPISTVSELALARTPDKLYDNIIVTRDFKYCGMVSILSLLRRTSEIERTFALELNPLTGLPGNVQINQLLNEVIKDSTVCCVLYFDLDYFKIYNDAYGFKLGDEIIKMTKDVIVRAVGQKAAFSSFVGHIGGDDFIAVLTSEYCDCEKLCAQIIGDFERESLPFFSEPDRARGKITGKARGLHQACDFPLTTISIAGLYGCMSEYETPDRLSFALSEVKTEVKERTGSNFIIKCIGMHDSLSHSFE